MDNNIIDECTKLSLEGKLAFPDLVITLIANGTERYFADLIGLKKTYFSINDETHTSKLVLENPQRVATNFNEKEIAQAIADSQQNYIDYQMFLHRAMAAGCSHYEVFLTGKKVIYFGRTGSFHIEHFPQ